MRKFLSSIQHFLSELRRRNVYQVAVTYAAVGFVVIEAADLTFVRLGLPSWTVTLVIALVGLGFPIALVMAWALEMTPEGVRVEEAKSSKEVPAPTRWTRDLWVGASVLVLLLLGAWWMWGDLGGNGAANQVQHQPSEIDERSIAVLPFEPLSSGEESETFARGVHGDLITRLSNISDLRITPRTSVQKYSDTKLSLPTIADSLNVRWVVEGEVQQAQDQIQINAKLIDPKNDANIWAKDYRRDLTAEDLFAIQEEITGEIADALKAELTAGEQERIAGAPTEDLRAYHLYVQGRSNLNSRTGEGMAKALRYFRRAVQRDSTYALAWAGLADAAMLFPTYAPDSVEAPDIRPEEAARRALQLNSTLAEAHATLGFVQGGAAGLRSLRRAVDLKPSYAQARHWLAINLLVAGHLEKARDHISLAVELSPEHRAARAVLANVYVAEGEYQKALSEIDQVLKGLARAEVPAYGLEQTERIRFGALYSLGRFEEARRLAHRRVKEANTPTWVAGWRARLGMTEVARGDTTQALRRLRRLRETPFQRGLLQSALGEKEVALMAFREVQNWLTYQVTEFRYFYPEVLGPLREDSRYDNLIEKINRQHDLNRDGSLPEESHSPTGPRTDA